MLTKPTQDSRLDQNGNDTETTCPFDRHLLMGSQFRCSCHPTKVSGGQYPSTGAQNRHRNGITTETLSWVVDLMSRCQPMRPVERLPQKRKQTEALLYGR